MQLPCKLPLLLDGAIDACLAEGTAEQWMLEHPDAVIALQRRYALAGCDILCTPTAGANRAKLAQSGRSGEVHDINRRLAAITRRAADEAAAGGKAKKCLVAGCLSSTGLKPPPIGNTSAAEYESLFAEQARALKEAGVDLLVCESMPSLSEARAALLATRKTGLPVLVTLTVDKEGKTPSGGQLLPAVITLQSLGASAIGLNGSGPSSIILPLTEALRYAAVPLIARPGILSADGPLTPAQYAREVKLLLDAGVAIIGGGEGTTPDHIAHLRSVLDKHPTVAPREIDTDACAVESEAFSLADDLNFSRPIPCDSDLADALIEAEERANIALVELTCPGDIDNLLEVGGMSRLPLAVHTDRAFLLDEALYRFPGRLLVDSLCEIERSLLKEITAQYGAIVV